MGRRGLSHPRRGNNRGWRFGYIAVPIGLGFAWWEGYHPWPSLAAHVSILTVIVIMISLAAIMGRGRQVYSSHAWLCRVVAGLRHPLQRSFVFLVGSLIWVAFVMAIVGWDLLSFLREVPALPTLSYLIGRVARFAAGRSILVALWLALGGFLALARRSSEHERAGFRSWIPGANRDAGRTS